MWVSHLPLTTILNNLSLFVFFLTNIFNSLRTLLNQIQFFRLSGDQPLPSLFFSGNRRNRLNSQSLTLIWKRSNRMISLPNLPNDFIIRISRKHMQHLFPYLLVLSLSFYYHNNAIYYFSLEITCYIIDFKIEDFKYPISWVVKLGGGTICMHYQLD